MGLTPRMAENNEATGGSPAASAAAAGPTPCDCNPEDIAAAALYLASPAGAYVTGKILEVDGGIIAPNLDLPIPDL